LAGPNFYLHSALTKYSLYETTDWQQPIFETINRRLLIGTSQHFPISRTGLEKNHYLFLLAKANIFRYLTPLTCAIRFGHNWHQPMLVKFSINNTGNIGIEGQLATANVSF